MTYEPGEILDIVVRNARVVECRDGSLTYDYSEGTGRILHEAEGVQIVRVLPAAGVPKVGELWEGRDRRFIAVPYGEEVRLNDGRGMGPITVSVAHHHHGPLHPVYQNDELDTAQITPKIARQVLWHYGEVGEEPGAFVKDLITLIAKADPHNRRMLAAQYPGYAAAVNAAVASETGIDELQVIGASDA